MKLFGLQRTLYILTFIIIGCNQQQNAGQNEENVIADDETHLHEQEIAEGDVWGEIEVNNFIQEAAGIDKMQIRAAEIAKKKARHEAVSGYAETIRTDHARSLENLKQIATQGGLTITDSIDADHHQKLLDLENNDDDFDRYFLEMMVQGHQKDIAKYQDAMKNITHHHPVKDWIDDVLPVLQQHLHSAQRLLDDNSIFPSEE